jgi:hypothetical protein
VSRATSVSQWRRVETAGDIASLTERLRDLEAEIQRIRHAIENHRPLKLDDALNGFRKHVTKELLGFKESLLTAASADVVRAKTALAKHVGKLILTPALRDGRPLYKVTGGITIPPDGEAGKYRKQLVARDGMPLYATLFHIPLGEVHLDPRGYLRPLPTRHGTRVEE